MHHPYTCQKQKSGVVFSFSFWYFFIVCMVSTFSIWMDNRVNDCRVLSPFAAGYLFTKYMDNGICIAALPAFPLCHTPLGACIFRPPVFFRKQKASCIYRCHFINRNVGHIYNTIFIITSYDFKDRLFPI